MKKSKLFAALWKLDWLMDRDTWHNSISMDLTRSFDSDGDYRCIYFIVDAAMVGFLPDVELDQFGTVESFNDLAAVSSDP